MQKTGFSILPFLAEAFSINKKIYKEIDKIYNTDKIRFIRIAKQDEFYNHQMAQEGSIEQEYYFKKSLGILNSVENENIFKSIIDICKKGWRYTYTYIQQNNNIEISEFMNRYIRKNKGLDNLSDDELNSNVTMLLFLSHVLEKEINSNDEFYKVAVEGYLKRIEHYKKENKANMNNLSKEKVKQIRELELKIKQHDKISYYPSSYRLSQEQQDGMLVKLNKLSKEDKFFSAFEYIFDFEEISLMTIVGKDLLKSKEIQELIFCYVQLFNIEDKIDYNELLKFIYPAIQIKYLCREYKKAKKFFFENFNEELYNEISQVENENKEIKKSNVLLQDENENLKLELEEIKRENRRLKQELNETENNKNELTALREFIFNLDIETPTPIIEEKLDYNVLNQCKGVVIGGHNNWQNKLKEVLTGWNYIPVESINFDENILRNNDYIFINVGYVSHAMYYKVMSIINKTDKQIYFINNQNIELCLNEIYIKLIKNKN